LNEIEGRYQFRWTQKARDELFRLSSKSGFSPHPFRCDCKRGPAGQNDLRVVDLLKDGLVERLARLELFVELSVIALFGGVAIGLFEGLPTTGSGAL
jgi:hypothetical protein